MRTHALRSLGLHGLDHLDAVVVAALASEELLLLVGPHGSAKSALLNRAAAALGLEHRHYNASLVSFDDLLGFPLPNEARSELQYLRTRCGTRSRSSSTRSRAAAPRCRTSCSRSCTSGA